MIRGLHRATEAPATAAAPPQAPSRARCDQGSAAAHHREADHGRCRSHDARLRPSRRSLPLAATTAAPLAAPDHSPRSRRRR